jgi:hypothetical protein
MKRIIYTLVFGIIGLLGMSSICKAESGLNNNEKELIEYFEKGIEYEGKHYNIPPQYINQGINYLKQSKVNITEEQKQKVYQTVVNMTLDGIRQGYLVLEEPLDSSEESSDPKLEEDKEAQAEVKQTDPLTGNTEASSQVSSDQRSLHINKDKINITQMIETAKELSADLGVKVSFDAEKHKVNVVNEEGRVVMMAEKIIKNTGYRIHQTIVVLIGLLLLFGVSVTAASRYRLFAHDDGS